MSVQPIPYFNDNYAYLVQHENISVLFDAGNGKEIAKQIAQHNTDLNAIVITHNHHDHDGGLRYLQKAFPAAEIFLPKRLSTESELYIDSLKIEIIHTPGHTMEHCCYYLPQEKAVITGDTLFAGGCGRCFTKKFELYAKSLAKLGNLPEGTLTYGAHEYLRDNVAFLDSIEQDTSYYKERLETIQYPSVGIPLEKEIEYNALLRTAFNGNAQEFIQLRKAKDSF